MERYEKYKDSGVECGDIPEGWAIKKIKHKCYVKARVGWKGLKSSEFLANGYAFLITGTDFVNDRIDWNNCYHIDKDRYDEDPYIQLQNEDLLITKDGTIGKLAVVEELEKPTCLNSGIFVVRSLTATIPWRMRRKKKSLKKACEHGATCIPFSLKLCPLANLNLKNSLLMPNC